MGTLVNVIRSVRNAGISNLLLGGTLSLGATLGLAPSPHSETIQATYTRGSAIVSVTLTIDDYSTPADLETLSQAFADGQDQALVTALSKTKAVGHCSIAGALSYDIAFIQAVITPTGRRIIFITNRPLQLGEAKSDSPTPSYDLAFGQFDLNDTDAAKSTGFLFPASKLLIDKQGELHYNLEGTPWSLLNVLDSKGTGAETLAQVP
ncbi:MAG: hypothetical protein WBQ94_11430 [Terracidiphilus sp.]